MDGFGDVLRFFLSTACDDTKRATVPSSSLSSSLLSLVPALYLGLGQVQVKSVEFAMRDLAALLSRVSVCPWW